MATKEKSYIPGVVLILIGAYLLLQGLDIISFRWHHLYPLILLAIGAYLLIPVFSRKDTGAAFPATFLLVLGLFFFFRNYDFFSWNYHFYDMGEFWPVFLIAFGLAFIVQYMLKPDDWGSLVPGVILLFLGAVFMARSLDWFYWFQFTDVWPVILIIIGGVLVASSLRRKQN